MFSTNTVYHTNIPNITKNRNKHGPRCFLNLNQCRLETIRIAYADFEDTIMVWQLQLNVFRPLEHDYLW